MVPTQLYCDLFLQAKRQQQQHKNNQSEESCVTAPMWFFFQRSHTPHQSLSLTFLPTPIILMHASH